MTAYRSWLVHVTNNNESLTEIGWKPLSKAFSVTGTPELPHDLYNCCRKDQSDFGGRWRRMDVTDSPSSSRGDGAAKHTQQHVGPYPHNYASHPQQ